MKQSLTISSLAYHEMRLFLAKVLWHFDVELSPKCGDWTNQKSFILWEKPELLVNLIPVVRDEKV